jgi:hypothetical protein
VACRERTGFRRSAQPSQHRTGYSSAAEGRAGGVKGTVARAWDDDPPRRRTCRVTACTSRELPNSLPIRGLTGYRDRRYRTWTSRVAWAGCRQGHSGGQRRPRTRTIPPTSSTRRAARCPSPRPALRSRRPARRSASIIARRVPAVARVGSPTTPVRAMRLQSASGSSRSGIALVGSGTRSNRTASGFTGRPGEFQRLVLPRLAGLSPSAMAAATGLSAGYCASIRDGKRVPDVRHWAGFQLAGLQQARQAGDRDPGRV